MIKRCDGCGDEIHDMQPSVTVELGDGDGMTIYTALPPRGHPLHWCHPCAVTAIAAVTTRRSS
ncbi:hypothetical protein C1I98_11185 [Spongiactinospora gelatinilytica]|uniref:Uncharacterized protein n=2 Tax=Spongiactinospora gelatinilytica TaxID=2666298 RepID=A0A2W2GMQ9_9ACTN|nr:hypothetical protein C1I98_11185 [Spongiactinospora gelatinilytica]